MAIIGNSIANRYTGRTLDGTSGADWIFGYGGNDWIYGGAGTDVMRGGTGSDTIYANARNVAVTFNWGTDWAYGGSGDDKLYFYNTTGATQLYGESGNDTVYGGYGNDYVSGGAGNDKVSGNSGNDNVHGDDGDDSYVAGGNGHDDVWGGNGLDYVYGGNGNDYVSGGREDTSVDNDGDYLTGGAGIDTFDFNYQQLNESLADTIKDFNPAADYIDAKYKGFSMHYHEAKIAGTGWNAAKAYAASVLDEDTWHVFVTDGINGYLFTDNSGDDVIDSGIEMRGLRSVNDFTYSDII